MSSHDGFTDDPGDLASRWEHDDVQLHTDQQWPGLQDFLHRRPEPAPSEQGGRGGARTDQPARGSRNAAAS